MQQHDTKVAIYIRVASKDDFAVEMQREWLCRLAKSYGYDNPVYYCDNGFSGLSLDRPAFSEMEAAIQNGTIDTIIVRDIFRISRNIIDALHWCNNISRCGVTIITKDDMNIF